MRRLTAILCLTVAVLLGSAGVSESADFQKGADAWKKRDHATALREWKPLAEQGHAGAQVGLGWMYLLGQGGLQGIIYAHMWGSLAASNGNKDGGKLRDFVAKKMTRSEIEKAQKLARECVRKKYKGC